MAASVGNRAPGSRAAVLDERTSRHASSASERGRQRLQGAILAGGASNQTLREQLKELSCERRKIARRRTEEERAEAFFPLRATTTAADSPRDCASSSK